MRSWSNCSRLLQALLALTSWTCDAHPPVHTLCMFSWILSPGPPEWRQYVCVCVR